MAKSGLRVKVIRSGPSLRSDGRLGNCVLVTRAVSDGLSDATAALPLFAKGTALAAQRRLACDADGSAMPLSFTSDSFVADGWRIRALAEDRGKPPWGSQPPAKDGAPIAKVAAAAEADLRVAWPSARNGVGVRHEPRDDERRRGDQDARRGHRAPGRR